MGIVRRTVLPGPCSGNVAEVTEWWQHIDHFLRTRRADVRTVLLMDAKARSFVTSAVGDRTAENQNEAGCALHELLLAVDFEEGPTWRWNRRERRRTEWWTENTRCGTRADEVLTIDGRVDCRATFVDVVLAAGQATKKRSRRCFSRPALLHATVRQTVTEMWNETHLLPTTWSVGRMERALAKSSGELGSTLCATTQERLGSTDRLVQHASELCHHASAPTSKLRVLSTGSHEGERQPFCAPVTHFHILSAARNRAGKFPIPRWINLLRRIDSARRPQ